MLKFVKLTPLPRPTLYKPIQLNPSPFLFLSSFHSFIYSSVLVFTPPSSSFPPFINLSIHIIHSPFLFLFSFHLFIYSSFLIFTPPSSSFPPSIHLSIHSSIFSSFYLFIFASVHSPLPHTSSVYFPFLIHPCF